MSKLSLIMKAIDEGDMTGFKNILNETSKPDFGVGAGNWTPLGYALVKDQFEMARMLAEEGASGVRHQPSGMNVALMCVEKGESETLRLLLGNTTDPDFGAGSGKWTPLGYALEKGEFEIARMLAEEGASGVRHQPSGMNVALMCVEKGESETLRLLLDNTTNPDFGVGSGQWTPLGYALEKGEFEMARMLAEEGASGVRHQPSGMNVALMCVEKGDNETMRLLLDNTTDPDFGVGSGQWTPLGYALEKGEFEMARMLAEAGASGVRYQPSGMNVALMCVEKGDNETLRFLLENTTKPDFGIGAGNWTPLGLAISKRNAKAIELLMDAGANIERTQGNGKSCALMLRELPKEPDLKADVEEQKVPGRGKTTKRESAFK